MSLIRIISFSYCIFLGCFFTYGQDNQLVRVSKYTQNDGLSSNHITKILKDKYGFMWVATQEGLNIFDGSSFQVFSNQSAPKRNLRGSYILDMIEDEKRSMIWILPSFAPVCGIDLESKTIIQSIEYQNENQVSTQIWARSLALQNDLLWIGGLNTLSAFHIPSKTYLDISEIRQELIALGEFNISKIHIDVFGNIWLLIDDQGIMVLNESHELIKSFSLKELGSTRKEGKLFFWDIVSSNHQVIIGTRWGSLGFATGLAPQDIKHTTVHGSQEENQPIHTLTMISDTLLVFATSNNLYLQNSSTLQNWKLIDENLAESEFTNIYQLYFDYSSNLVWLGSSSGLMSFSFESEPFSSITKSVENRISITHLESLFTVDHRLIYAGGTNGVYEIDMILGQIQILDSTKASSLVFQGPEKQIYVSSSKKLLIIDTLKKTLEEEERNIPDDLQGYWLNAAIVYSDTLILLSSFEDGLKVWNTRSNQVTNFPEDSIQNALPGVMHMNNLFQSNKNRFVNILTGNAIIQFNPIDNSYYRYNIINPNTRISSSNFMDMNESPDSYFIGTYGDGLVETDKQFNVKKIYTTQDGLSNNCIYRIFNIKDEKMLMTTNKGLSILDLKTKKIKTYYEGDGLHGNGFEQLCGYQKDNKIYVGGPGGFTIVNTDLLSDSSVAPILYPTGITINTHEGEIDSTHLEMSSFTIPNDAFKTTLTFVSPDYKNPDRMKYRYKIDELSEEWVELGNQNFVDLIGVNPGKYHFEVIATNSEGTDSKPLKMTLDFLPKWYQTTWFKILLLLLVAGLVYWVQRYRMIQIKKQQTIRKEIANDLHDDIGSTLNSLKIFAHLAQSDTNNKSHIEQIEESISEATVGLRDMIWVLEDEQDSVYEIMERIKKFASPICMAHDIEFVGTVNATSEKPIPKKIKRNIFLVAKECINNSVKYAECSRIEVVLAYSKSKLQLTIEDNGKGFDCDEITKGKGLDSMEYRANQVEFNCDIQSRVGSGTITTMQGTIG
ncbi:ATP-binding protein [Reichenbachiella sp.]